MKSDIKIATEIYTVIKDSVLEDAITGNLNKYYRPQGSDKEDIVISVIENSNGSVQEAKVNVDIYIADVADPQTGTHVFNEMRAELLSELAIELLEMHNGNGFRFELQSQRILKSETSNEHCISNKLQYRYIK